MKKRSRVNKRYSRRLFTRTAKRVHPKNLVNNVYRGGIRF